VTTNGRDRILIVESDPLISDLIARQALRAAGYQTYVVNDAASALARAAQMNPEVIIADLWLPGLSGKELMVSLTSQHLNTPVIILGRKGMEADVLPAFKLGASDYLLWPFKEPEVMTVVERVLKQVRERRERLRQAEEQSQANLELQMRVRELTAAFSLSKSIVSTMDPLLLNSKILNSAVQMTQADLGWFLLRSGDRAFHMAAYANLPDIMVEPITQQSDDSIISMATVSGEPISLHGEALKRFRLSALGQSVLVVPVKEQREVIGLLVMMRQQATPFKISDQNLLSALAQYATIALSNSRSYLEAESKSTSLKQQMEHARTGEKIGDDLLYGLRHELSRSNDAARTALDRMLKDRSAQWTNDQRQALTILQDQVKVQGRVIDALAESAKNASGNASLDVVRLNDLVRASANAFRPAAQQNGISLSCDVPTESLCVEGIAEQLSAVLAGLISNAIQHASLAGRVTVRLEKSNEQMVHLIVADSGAGIEARRLSRIFENNNSSEPAVPRPFAGLGIRLPLAKEIVTNHQGKIWVESKPGQGANFHVVFPLVKQ
jgi:signal transduction histidine kinase/DNA-binding response OmpR family regulator